MMIENICDDCGLCCQSTEMIISIEDIEIILEHSHNTLKKEDFSLVNKEGFFQLKNNPNGNCVFFNSTSKMCNIYDVRPQGCRFYPLIYSIDAGNCILDKDCPRTDIYFHNKKEQKTVCKNLKKFLKEKLFVKL